MAQYKEVPNIVGKITGKQDLDRALIEPLDHNAAVAKPSNHPAQLADAIDGPVCQLAQLGIDCWAKRLGDSLGGRRQFDIKRKTASIDGKVGLPNRQLGFIERREQPIQLALGFDIARVVFAQVLVALLVLVEVDTTGGVALMVPARLAHFQHDLVVALAVDQA